MTRNQAKKLHNGDEVSVKHTGEVVTVVRNLGATEEDPKGIWIEAMTQEGWMKLRHTEID